MGYRTINKNRFIKHSLWGLFWVALLVSNAVAIASDNDDDESDDDDEVKITFVHTGDFHGDLEPHDNARAGSVSDIQEGGLARVATIVKDIRQDAKHSIHVHTGDTIAGSAAATFTRGDALVQVVDQLGIDVFTPGNWEFSFGIYRFLQYFGNQDGSDLVDPGDRVDEMAIPIPPADQGMKSSFGAPFPVDQHGDTRRWGIIASNVYINGTNHVEPGISKGDDIGELLTQPYRIMTVGGVKIGFFGCTTNRGPQVVSSRITSGISFTNCKGEVRFPQNRPVSWGEATTTGLENRDPADPSNGFKVDPEIPKWVNHLRTVEQVDIVVMLSEAGLAENIYNAENFDGIDIIFSSDMHEATLLPVAVSQPSNQWGSKTVILEQGEDGIQVGELEITVEDGKLDEWEWKRHAVTSAVEEDEDIAELIEEVLAPFHGEDFTPGAFDNPYSGALLTQDLDTSFGTTEIELSRNRFSTEVCADGQGCIDEQGFAILPGVVGGSGHYLAVDVFRKVTGADVGGLRGFRYTNTVLPGGEVTQDALYHYYPIGAVIAKGAIWATQESDNNTARVGGWPRNLVQEIELGANSSMNPIVTKWSGGWFWNYSGIHFNLDPEGPNFADSMMADANGKYARISNLMLENPDTGAFDVPLISKEKVQYASYYYDNDPNRINRNQIKGKGPACVALENAWRADERHDLSVEEGGDGIDLAQRWQDYEDCLRGRGQDVGIKILTKEVLSGDYILVSSWKYKNGIDAGEYTPLDAVEVIGRYLSEKTFDVYEWSGDDAQGNGGSKLLSHTVQGQDGQLAKAGFDFPRIMLDNQLVDSSIEFGFPAIEPLRGAEGGISNGNVSVPTGYIIGEADTPSDEGDF